MATRQYIGARYTPKFSGTYNNTQAYEALEVVDNGSGTTYIARKPVPPNTPLTNTDYWLVYGSSSGAILDLQGRMTTAEEEITTINSSILSIGGRLTTDEGAITANAAAITNINKKLNHKYVFIGDSYMEANYEGAGTSFVTLTAQALGLTLNMDYFVSAVSGYGFARPDRQFVTLLQNISIGTTDPNDITDVIVCGGANDRDYTASITNAIVDFNSAMHTRFPNAKLHLGFTDWYPGSGIQYSLMIEKWKDGAYLTGAKFIDGIWMAQHNWAWKTTTGTSAGHPNSTGQQKIAACLIEYMLKGSISYPVETALIGALVADRDYTIGSGGGVTVSGLAGLSAYLCIQYSVFTAPSAVSLSPTSPTTLTVASVRDGCFVGCTNGSIKYAARCVIYDGSDNKTYCDCIVNITDSKLQITPYVSSSISMSRIALETICLENLFMNC